MAGQGMKMKVGDDANHHDLKLVSDFLKEVNEDVLFEIFLRLPNCQSVILFGSLCHCFHSLISQPEFIPRFISQHHEHQDRYPLPYTILFRKADKRGSKVIRPESFQPICKLFSKESMFLHGKTAAAAATYLDFLPSPMFIRASCNDLLLVSPSERSTLADRYICNPITKKIYKLPKTRRSGMCLVTGHALVVCPGPTNQLKVVEFQHPQYDEPEPESDEPASASLTVTIFSSSKSGGKWKIKCFLYPRPKKLCANYSVDVATCNGIVYWLEYERDVDRVIALDLLNSQCGAIVFPDDFWWFRSLEDSHVREQIGVVGGELRLLQVVLTSMESIVNFKVWKLNYKDSNSWVLVHDIKNLKRPSNEQQQQLIAPFVHPTNGDVVFIVWGKSVFEYNLTMEDTYEMIDQLEESLSINPEYIDRDRLMSFPMVHPPWPTPLPRSRRFVMQDDLFI